jgi:hypothetical protein
LSAEVQFFRFVAGATVDASFDWKSFAAELSGTPPAKPKLTAVLSGRRKRKNLKKNSQKSNRLIPH